MTNYLNSSYSGLNNINSINSDYITFTDSINDIDSTTFNYLKNATSNIQNQITNIQTGISTGSTGGSFCIYGETTDLKTTVNNGFFGFGSALVTPAYKLGVFLPACKLVSIGIASTSSPTITQPIVSIVKLAGGTNPGTGGLSGVVSTITIPFLQSYNRINTDISFALGDAVNIQTTTSSGNVCGNTKITLIFQTAGVQGIQGNIGNTPNLSIGTVTSLLAGNIPTASLTGTTANPILNFGLVKGDIGLSPVLSIGSVTSSSTIPTVAINNNVLSFGLVKGDVGNTPVLTIGNVNQTNIPNVTITNGTVLNFDLVKGDKGDPGARGHTGASTLEAIAAAGEATAAAGSASGSAGASAGFATASATSATASATSATAAETAAALIQTNITALEGRVTIVETDVGLLNSEVVALQTRCTALEITQQMTNTFFQPNGFFTQFPV